MGNDKSPLPIASSDLPRFVFVYGTLKRGYGNNRLLKYATFVGEALTAPEFTLISLGGFPGLLIGGDTAVKGEIYEVHDSEDLLRLDGLEGHPNWYRRTPVTVYQDGAPVVVDTYIYLAARGSEQKIASGEWSRESVLA